MSVAHWTPCDSEAVYLGSETESRVLGGGCTDSGTSEPVSCARMLDRADLAEWVDT